MKAAVILQELPETPLCCLWRNRDREEDSEEIGSGFKAALTTFPE